MGFNDDGLGEAMRQAGQDDALKGLSARVNALEGQLRIVDAAQDQMLDLLSQFGKLVVELSEKVEARNGR